MPNLMGFSLSQRRGQFDWRQLHGIDVDTVVRLTDVGTIESALDTLQHGSLEGDATSTKSCIQLFRLLQLAIEYLWHLRNAHVTLLDRYHAATDIASRWITAAQAYLEAGHTFLNCCMQTGDIERFAVESLDATRRALEEQDAHYNAALDKLEDEDQRARYFHFRKQRAELQWQLIYSVDLDELAARVDVQALDKVLRNLVYGSIMSEDCEELTPHHFKHLIPLAQAGLDYMLFQANSTGAALERAMVGLQSTCSDIPALTGATQDMHMRITEFLRETRQHATQLSVLGSPVRPASVNPTPLTPQAHLQQQLVNTSLLRSPLQHQLLQQQQQLQQLQQQQQQTLYPPPLGQTATPVAGAALGTGHPGVLGTHPLLSPGAVPLPMQPTLSAGDVLKQQQLGAMAPSSSTQPGLGPSPLGTTITGGFAVSPTGMPLGATPEELHALSLLGVPLQALGAYQQASQLNAGMDSLEHDLRLERVKTEEMHQIVRSLRGTFKKGPEGHPVLDPANLPPAHLFHGAPRHRKSPASMHARMRSNTDSASPLQSEVAGVQQVKNEPRFEQLKAFGSMEEQMDPSSTQAVLRRAQRSGSLQRNTSTVVEDFDEPSASLDESLSLAGVQSRAHRASALSLHNSSAEQRESADSDQDQQPHGGWHARSPSSRGRFYSPSRGSRSPSSSRGRSVVSSRGSRGTRAGRRSGSLDRQATLSASTPTM